MNTKINEEILFNPLFMSASEVKRHEQKEESSLIAFMISLKELVDDVQRCAAKQPQAKQAKEAKQLASPQNVEKSLVALARALGMLQVKIAQFGEDRLEMSNRVAQINIDIIKEAVKQFLEDLNKMEKKAAEAKKWGLASKILTGVLVGVGVAIACATGQFFLAAILITTYALQISGGMDKLSGEDGVITKWVEKTFKVSNQDAMLIASAIVVAATIVVTFGAGAVTSSLAEAGTVAPRSSEILGQALKNSMFAGVQTMGTSGFVDNAGVMLAKLCAGGNKEKEQKLEIVFSVLLSALLIALTMGMGPSSSAISQNKLSLFVKLGTGLDGLARAAEGGAQVGLGKIMLDQANLEQEMGDVQARKTLATMNLSAGSKERTADMNMVMNMLKSLVEQTAAGELAWAKGWQALADILARSAA